MKNHPISSELKHKTCAGSSRSLPLFLYFNIYLHAFRTVHVVGLLEFVWKSDNNAYWFVAMFRVFPDSHVNIIRMETPNAKKAAYNNKFSEHITSLCACPQPSNFKSHKNSHIHFVDIPMLLSIDSGACTVSKTVRISIYTESEQKVEWKSHNENKLRKRKSSRRMRFRVELFFSLSVERMWFPWIDTILHANIIFCGSFYCNTQLIWQTLMEFFLLFLQLYNIVIVFVEMYEHQWMCCKAWSLYWFVSNVRIIRWLLPSELRGSFHAIEKLFRKSSLFQWMSFSSVVS